MKNGIKKEPVLIRGDKVKVEHIEWLWPNRIPYGMLTLLAGIGGISKSTLSLYIAAQITTGRPFIDETTTGRKPGDVIILSAEDTPGNIIIPRFMAMGGDRTRIHILTGVKLTALNTSPDPNDSNEVSALGGIDSLTKAGDLDMLQDSIKNVPNPKLVIIDPYTAYMGNADSNDNTKVRGFLRPLSELASEYNIGLIGITHLNKKEDSSADFRVLGSVGQQNAARMVWLVATDPNDFERRCFVWLKGNLAPRHLGLSYRLISTDVKTSDGQVSNQPACAFEKEPCILTAAELLAPKQNKSTGRPKKQTDASEWLESFLSEGPVNSKLIYEEGQALGYSQRTLKRVKSSMGIMGIPIREKNSMKVIRWEWRLKSNA